MTRLTDLSLINIRGEDPEPIPFPTKFCNMIYLQRFISIRNYFSGFERIVGALLKYILSFFFHRPNTN